MTGLILTAVVLVGLASTFPATAQNARPAATACPAVSEEEVAALARRFAEEGHSNPAVHDEILAEAVVFQQPVGTGILNKAEAWRRAEELRAAFPGIWVTADVVVVQGDTAAVAWTAEGTNRGEFDGMQRPGGALSGKGSRSFASSAAELSKPGTPRTAWGTAGSWGSSPTTSCARSAPRPWPSRRRNHPEATSGPGAAASSAQR